MARKLLYCVILTLTIAVAASASPAAQVNAPANPLVAWEFDSVGSSQNNGKGYALGEVFVPTQNFILDFLGYFGTVGGFAESHEVGLYLPNGILLSATTVNNTSVLNTSHFVGNAITPVPLFAGQTYVIVGASGTVDSYAWNDPGFTVEAPIDLLGDNWIENGGVLQFTSTTVIGDVADGYWGPNFGWEATATPEPGSILLLGSGLLGAFGVARGRFLR